MPELPEVETIAESLRRAGEVGLPLVGQTLVGATLRWPRHIAQPTALEFAELVRGQTVRAIGRRGKFLVLDLDRHTLLIHLRMSGDLRMAASAARANERRKRATIARVMERARQRLRARSR